MRADRHGHDVANHLDSGGRRCDNSRCKNGYDESPSIDFTGNVTGTLGRIDEGFWRLFLRLFGRVFGPRLLMVARFAQVGCLRGTLSHATWIDAVHETSVQVDFSLHFVVLFLLLLLLFGLQFAVLIEA